MFSTRIALPTMLLCLVAIVSTAQAAQPPNVVFIMADDLGFAELGCYGQKKIRTPHIDRLARDGMRVEIAIGAFLDTPREVDVK